MKQNVAQASILELLRTIEGGRALQDAWVSVIR